MVLGKLLEGRRGLFASAVRGTEWSQFLDYITPSFFDVMGVRDLLSQGRELAANLADREAFADLEREQARRLAGRGAVLDLAPSAEPGEEPVADDRALGQRILEVYFGQLFAADETILDVRGTTWAWPAGAEAPSWRPRALWIRWEPAFLEAARDMYQGFYRDDDAAFTRGVRALQLESAADVLRAHFGEDDQRAVVFETKVFHSSFHEVFVRCRDEGASLHRNFLALGIYLACLYDALDGRGPLDVRDAFERAAS
jgi:hypothetical protein